MDVGGADRSQQTGRLRLLAISDTHLGEETSLLSFPHGLQHLWSTLQKFWGELFPGFDPEGDPREQVEIDELILVGDVPDRTLSSTSQVYNHCHAFSQMMGSAARIKKAIYMPGNHDHTLWTEYVERRSGGEEYGVTGPDGDLVVNQGVRDDPNKCAEEILAAFFGYPIGWAWWSIKGAHDFDFAVANPVYVKEVQGRTYVFAHGTHFRPEIASSRWKRGLMRAIDISHLDSLANLDLEPLRDLTEAENLQDLERLVSPFVDSMWPSSKNEPTSKSDELWYLFTLLRGGLGEKRSIPDGSEIFSLEKLRDEDTSSRVARLTNEGNPTEGSLERWRDYFRGPMLGYLGDRGFSREETVFVYGDTHGGGWGELPSDDGHQIRIYNTGGWTMEPIKDHHPACHLFAVDEAGEEYIFDVSFKKARVGEDLLLDLAARDSEHRRDQVSGGVRGLGGLIGGLLHG